MKSPFPGMDPYLEARWSDVHVKLTGFIGEALTPLLPPGLRARSEERIVLEETDEPLQRYRSDVAVVELGKRDPAAGMAVAPQTLQVPEPVVIRFYEEPEIDRWVQIIDVTNGGRVVTAIEILSPSNKSPGRVNELYQQKVEDYAASGVNLVEVDLLRSPRGRLKVTELDIPQARRTAYTVGVRRASRRDRWEMYPIPLRVPIPPIPVPLRTSDADVMLHLQPLIDRVYQAGGHDDIDYTKPAVPPLSAEDEAWADALLRAAGKR